MNIGLDADSFAVHRRTGGLEIRYRFLPSPRRVHRRTGGLENFMENAFDRSSVHRRTGGLER